ncbi:hypothetical protein lpa_00082 [Legionella pneumophila 2300/99 Alcoy]|nr:hypothetical protein lpa_00082 [Legionella pneumophila 2300/99 Alcoy]
MQLTFLANQTLKLDQHLKHVNAYTKEAVSVLIHRVETELEETILFPNCGMFGWYYPLTGFYQ